MTEAQNTAKFTDANPPLIPSHGKLDSFSDISPQLQQLLDQIVFQHAVEQLGQQLKQQMEQVVHKYAVEQLGQQVAKPYIDLEKAYKQINDAARRGQPVSAQDISTAEDNFNNDMTKVMGQVLKEIKQQVQKKPGDETAQDNETDRWLAEITKAGRDYAVEDKELFKASRDGRPLEQAFYTEHLQHNSHPKDDTLPAGIKDVPTLLSEMLSRYQALAVGDIHIRSNSVRLIAENMAVLRDAGVDAIYLEAPDGFFDKLNKLSVDELEQLARDKKLGSIKLTDAKKMAELYNVGHADDIWTEWVKMMAEAKKNGIRVVNVDKKGLVREVELLMFGTEHRFATTNFIWPDNIEQDRQAMTAAAKDDGNEKYRAIAKDGGNEKNQPLAKDYGGKAVAKDDGQPPAAAGKDGGDGKDHPLPAAAGKDGGDGKAQALAGAGKDGESEKNQALAKDGGGVEKDHQPATGKDSGGHHVPATAGKDGGQNQALAAAGKDGGKFILFGGLDHFIFSGLVARAFGAPVIAFDHSDKNAAGVYSSGWSLSNGPNIYLPGGPDYPETRKMVRVEDIKEINAVLKPMRFIYGVPVITGMLDAVSSRYQEDINKSVDIKPPFDLPFPKKEPEKNAKPERMPPDVAPPTPGIPTINVFVKER